MKTAARRNGYAMLLVLVFMVLLFSLSSVAYRHIGAGLRGESIRAAQVIRDEGSVIALSRALALLQTGPPPYNPYECGVTIETSSGLRDFTVTMSSQEEGKWTVHSAPAQPGDSPEPMPISFAVAPE